MAIEHDLYFISMAARLLDMHPQTLRKYERLGLVRPTRTVGSMRVYSQDELERLRLIKHLVDEVGREPGRRAAAAGDCRSRCSGCGRWCATSRGAARHAQAGWRARSSGSARWPGCSRRAGPDSGEADDGSRGACGLQGLLHDARRRQDGVRQGDQAGVPQAGAQAPPRRQPGRQGAPRRSSRRSTRPTKCSATPRSAASTTSSARTGGSTSRRSSRASRWGGAPFGRCGQQPGRRRRRLPDDDRRGDAGPVRQRGSVLRFLPARSSAAAARGGGRQRAGGRRATQKGRDIEHEVELTLEEAYHGATRRMSIKEGGHARSVDVRIPAGVKDGSRVRAAGEGESGANGGASGDLYLRVRIRPHPMFERKGRRPALARRRAGHDRGARRRGAGADAHRRRAPEDSGDHAERPGVPAEGPRHAGGRQAGRARRPLRHRRRPAPPLADARSSASTTKRCADGTSNGEAATSRQRQTIMNINKYTEKAQEAVLGAQQLADRDGHPEITPGAPPAHAPRAARRHRARDRPQDECGPGGAWRRRSGRSSRSCRARTAARRSALSPRLRQVTTRPRRKPSG